MATATERIVVLVTAKEKATIAKMARDAHLSMCEFFRRAAASFHPCEDEQLLEGMVEQMRNAAAQANTAIDDALAFVDASNKRIAAMESGRTY